MYTAPEKEACHSNHGCASLHHHGVLHIDGGVLAEGEALGAIQRVRIGTSGIVGDQIGDFDSSAIGHTGGTAAGDLAIHRQSTTVSHLHRAIADDLCVIAGGLALGMLVGGMLYAAHNKGTVHRQGLVWGNSQLTEGLPGCNGRTGACSRSHLISGFIAGTEGHHQRHIRRDDQILGNSRILGQKHRVAGACFLHHRRKLAQLTLVHVPRLVIAGRLVKLGNQRYPLFGHAGIGVLQRQQLVAAVKPAVELAAVFGLSGVGLLGALRNRLIQVVTADGAVFRLVRCDAYRHVSAGQVDILDPRGVFAVKLIHFIIIPKTEINGLTCFKRNTSRLPSGFTGVIDGLFCINCV